MTVEISEPKPEMEKVDCEQGKITQTFRFERETRTPQEKVKHFVKNRMRILNWIGQYNSEAGINDFIAGITLGLTIIPESIACALLAGLPARYGLCSAFIGSFVYLFFGSIDKVIIGPTSLVALVSVQFTVGKPIEFAFLLTFLSGIMQLIMGSLQLGFIFEFISIPVIKAFSSATALLVIESQLKVLLGIKYLVAGLPRSLQTLFSRINEANMGDLVMGICAITFLVIFEQFERLSNNPKIDKVTSIILRYLSFARNTLIVFITAFVSAIWVNQSNAVPYSLNHNALSGLPNFTLPAFTVQDVDKVYTFWDILAELNVGIVVIPIVGILTNISIGKLTPKGLVDTNQELLTVGLCNVVGACVQSMPTSGAFSRYAISTGCGLKTPMANLYSGIIVLLSLSYFSPYFNYIPEATLAAILICSIYTLFDFRLPIRLWRDSKRDFFIWNICFIVSLFYGVEVGLVVSILVTVAHLLLLWARPDVQVKINEYDGMEFISVIPGNGIYFPAISYLRKQVLKPSILTDFKIPIVLDCQKVAGLDYTSAQGLSKLSIDLSQKHDPDCGALLIIYRMSSHLQQFIENTSNLVFCDSQEKVGEFLTQEALRTGHICVQKHIRDSIDLGRKVDMEHVHEKMSLT